MATEPLTGSRIPDSSFAPNIPQDISNAVRDLADNTVPRFANASARDAAFASWVALGNSMASGLMCFTQSDGRLWRYDTASSSWLYAGGNPPPIVAAGAGAGWNVVASRPIGCYKDAAGLVHVVGCVSPATSYNPQDSGTHTAAVLPVGYRPALNTNPFFVATPGALSYVLAFVDTAGVINISSGSVASIAAATPHYFDTIPPFHPAYAGSVPLS